jgi:hypothetical protein
MKKTIIIYAYDSCGDGVEYDIDTLIQVLNYCKSHNIESIDYDYEGGVFSFFKNEDNKDECYIWNGKEFQEAELCKGCETYALDLENGLCSECKSME